MMDLAAENKELKLRLALAEDIKQRYGTLFDSIDEGFCVIEVIGGEGGDPLDYRFLETNASFERQTGLFNAVGRRMREMEPRHEEHWFERYFRIAKTQIAERFEDCAEALGRWYDVYAFPIDDPGLRRVGILFRDIIERKRSEQELARSHGLLRTTFDNSLQIIQLFKAVRDDRDAIVDFEWLLTNKQWNDRYGSNVGKRLLAENPAVVGTGVWDKFLQVMENGVPITHEHYYNHEQFDGWFLQTIAKADDGILLSTLDITEWKRADIARRESEERYRTLFETMGQGYCELELVRDEDGRAVDQLYLELNPAFERLFGIAVADAKGRRASELFPFVDPMWTATFDMVARTKTPQSFENQHGPHGRWYETFVYPGSSDRVVMLYEDITNRKRAEQVLRESEERQAFLLKLSDALRPLSDPVEIKAVACETLGRHLGVGRCGYGEVDATDEFFIVDRDWTDGDMASFKGKHLLVSFGPEFTQAYRAGRSVMIDDALEDARAAGAEAAFEAAGSVRASLGLPLIKNGRFVAGLFVQQIRPRKWTAKDEALARDVIERTWDAVERSRAEAALRESEERFTQFAKASSAGLWIRDAGTLAMEYVSPAVDTIYGTDRNALLGTVERWAAMIVPDDRSLALGHLDQAQQGEAVVHEFRIQRSSDGAFRWIRNADFPLYDNGNVQRIGGIAEDVTETKQLTAHQSVLLAELQHRVRNIMAMIRSMTNRGGESTESVADYRELLSGRLLALARVQTILTRQGNKGGPLRGVIESEIGAQAHNNGQYQLTGPDVTLSPKAMEVLTLAFHELSTNALKYGALSVPGGQVKVTWSVAEKKGIPWLFLDWVENGAPPRDPPTRRGFGTELIEGKIPYELGGVGKISLEPDGARCHFELPLREGESILETDAPAATSVFGGSMDMTGAPDLSGQSILVVEDDYYLATDTSAALRGAGAQVLGPCPNEEATAQVLASEVPTAAVVDLNLGGGGPRFEIARLLRKQGVPFIFLTGYDADAIPEDYADIVRLEKPVPLRDVVEAVSLL